MAQAAGHDINYIALAGALAHFGRAGGKPTPPINLVGDFGGGGMFMAFGVVCGILEAQRSGKGQVIDVAMVDGTAILMSMMWGLKQIGVLGRGARHQRARHRRAVLRHVRDDRRQVHLARFARAAVLRGAHPNASASRAKASRRRWTATGWDTLRDAVHRAVQDQDARRVGRDPRGQRRVLTRRCCTMSGGDEQRAHQGARARSSSATACRSRRRRRASRARRARCSARRRGPASTPTRRSPTGASPPTRSRSSGTPKPSRKLARVLALAGCFWASYRSGVAASSGRAECLRLLVVITLR